MPFEVGRDEIQRAAGKLFDRTVVRAFLAISASKWVAIRDEAASVQISTILNSGGLSFASSDDRDDAREVSIQLQHLANAPGREGAYEKTPCHPKPECT